jgi:putative membrane protein
MPAHFLATLPNFLAYLGTAIVLLVAFVAIYLYVTPYDEINLIRANNVAAAISLSGAVLGFAMPIANVIAHSDTLADLAVWGVIAGIVQLLAWMVARVALPRLKEAIAAGQVAPAIFVAALSVTVGLINAACMTY